jgi:hypothetical protein
MAEQPGQEGAKDPVSAWQSPAQTTTPGLPPTALSMQMTSLNDQYEQQRQSAEAELTSGGPLMFDQGAQQGLHAAPGAPKTTEYGHQGLQDMAEQLARSYGLDFSRGSLIDAQGNFQMTPDQMAGGSDDVGGIAANMTYVAQAINDWQVDQQQNKATAALQAGMGQIQQRGRGSLAAMQSNFYQQMAANYTDPNLLPEQADFSYWIQKAGFDEAAETRAKEEAESGLTGGGGSGSGSGADMFSQPTASDPSGSTDFGQEGKGDVVTSGPHAGQRPVYIYDPINQTTTIIWEDA